MRRWVARALLALAACSGRRAAEPPPPALATVSTAFAGASWLAVRGGVTVTTTAPSFADEVTVARPVRVAVTTATGTVERRGWAAVTQRAVVVVSPGSDESTATLHLWPSGRELVVSSPRPPLFVRGIWCSARAEHCVLVWWGPGVGGVSWYAQSVDVDAATLGPAWQVEVDDAGLLAMDLYQTVVCDPREPVLYVLEARAGRWAVRALDVLGQRERWRRELPDPDSVLASPPQGAALVELSDDGATLIVVTGVGRHGTVGLADAQQVGVADGSLGRRDRRPFGTNGVAATAPVPGRRLAALSVIRGLEGGGEGAFFNFGERVTVLDLASGEAQQQRLPHTEAPAGLVAQGDSFALVPSARPWHSYPAVPAAWPKAGLYDEAATVERLRAHLRAARGAAARPR